MRAGQLLLVCCTCGLLLLCAARPAAGGQAAGGGSSGGATVVVDRPVQQPVLLQAMLNVTVDRLVRRSLMTARCSGGLPQITCLQRALQVEG